MSHSEHLSLLFFTTKKKEEKDKNFVEDYTFTLAHFPSQQNVEDDQEFIDSVVNSSENDGEETMLEWLLEVLDTASKSELTKAFVDAEVR